MRFINFEINMKNRLVQVLLISTFALLASCGDKASNQAEMESTDEDKILSLNEMKLTTLDGAEVNLSDYKGKKVLINFWATWCRPCIAEMPNLENAKLILEQEDFVVLSISDEGVDKIKNFADKNPYAFTWLKLEQKVMEFEVYALPKTIVLDKEGNQIWEHSGIEEWDSPEILGKLRAL
ncbi:redoxin domain-containing protein [Peijinzhouia sedimentorum]